VLNKPLEQSATSTGKGAGRLSQTARYDKLVRDGLTAASGALTSLQAELPTGRRAALTPQLVALRKVLAQLPAAVPKKEPVTLGVGEPFSQTTLIALYFAILFTLPLILYQAYAFVLPAFSPRERRVALPLMLMVPVLFSLGVLFCYFLVLPAAIRFLQNFNKDSFDVLVRASDFYKFEILTMIALGGVFQVPVGILAANKMGLVDAKKLRANRRYAIVIIAVVAAALPGTDPVTTLLEMVPLLALYELSILLVRWMDRGPPASLKDVDEAVVIDHEPDPDPPDEPDAL